MSTRKLELHSFLSIEFPVVYTSTFLSILTGTGFHPPNPFPDVTGEVKVTKGFPGEEGYVRPSYVFLRRLRIPSREERVPGSQGWHKDTECK